MTTRPRRRHVVRGLLGGLVLGLGAALLLWIFGVRAVSGDIAIALGLLLGLALGLVRLPRTAAPGAPDAKDRPDPGGPRSR